METFFNVSEQMTLFLGACVLGVFLGVSYDFFRVARIILKHNKTAIFLEDFFYTVIFALAIFVYCTENSRGEIRFYIILGAVLCFILYLLTVGFFVVTIIRIVVMFIYKIVSAVYRIVFAPIIKMLVSICQKIKGDFVKSHIISKIKAEKFQKHLKTANQIVYNKHTNKQVEKKIGGENNGSKKNKKNTHS